MRKAATQHRTSAWRCEVDINTIQRAFGRAALSNSLTPFGTDGMAVLLLLLLPEPHTSLLILGWKLRLLPQAFLSKVVPSVATEPLLERRPLFPLHRVQAASDETLPLNRPAPRVILATGAVLEGRDPSNLFEVSQPLLPC